jgi:hypothetical protein
LTTADLMRIVIGSAAADAVTSRYATACIHSDHRLLRTSTSRRDYYLN